MSLVAYDASSDEESSDDEAPENLSIDVNGKSTVTNGHISDDDYFDQGQSVEPQRKHLNLPQPSKVLATETDENESTDFVPSFNKLPEPKSTVVEAPDVEEEDDEFLHKKELPPAVEKPPAVKGTVKITIPSLSEFKDVDENRKKQKPPGPSIKPSGLLNMLPKPKHEGMFAKLPASSEGNKTSTSKTSSLVPDSVKNRHKADIEKKFNNPLKASKNKRVSAIASDSEGSDDDGGDFFSLNSETKLPEVSANEINAMVAKKAAKMAETYSKIDQLVNSSSNSQEKTVDEGEEDTVVPEEVAVDEKALQVLVGSRAKRRKVEELNVVELSSAEVLPNKDEWLRTALASSTSYQAKGVLVDEEPAPGTRKKHQITYLAHQAKANELELQAMWAANRHTRRQTQSKYGF